MSKRPTFAAAKAALLDHLERAGWTVSRHLKVPHATHGWGRSSVRIWFKPQALYYSCGEGTTLNMARSLWVDVRDETPEAIEQGAIRSCDRSVGRDPASGGTSGDLARPAERGMVVAPRVVHQAYFEDDPALRRDARLVPPKAGCGCGCASKTGSCGRGRDPALGGTSGRRRRPRYEIRGYAPSDRAKRGWIYVRTTRQEFNDPREAASELARLQRMQLDPTVTSKWRYQVVDRGEGGRRDIGPVVTVEELRRRGGSRDPARQVRGTRSRTGRDSLRRVGRDLRPLSEDERALVQHVRMWGSGGYPVAKLGRGWVWRDWRGVRGSPIVYKTKRDAVAAFEGWMDLARMRLGEEAYARATARTGRDAVPDTRREPRKFRAPVVASGASRSMRELTEVLAMTRLLREQGYGEKARAAAAYYHGHGMDPAELEYRLRQGELRARDPGRSKVRQNVGWPTRRRTR